MFRFQIFEANSSKIFFVTFNATVFHVSMIQAHTSKIIISYVMWFHTWKNKNKLWNDWLEEFFNFFTDRVLSWHVLVSLRNRVLSLSASRLSSVFEHRAWFSSCGKCCSLIFWAFLKDCAVTVFTPESCHLEKLKPKALTHVRPCCLFCAFAIIWYCCTGLLLKTTRAVCHALLHYEY